MKEYVDIYDELLQRKKELLPELNSDKPNAIWKLMLEIFAFGLHRLYGYFKLFQSNIDEELKKRRAGTVEYYEQIIKETLPEVTKVHHRESASGLFLSPFKAGNTPCTALEINTIQSVINEKKLLGYPVWTVNIRLHEVTILVTYAVYDDSVVQTDTESAITVACEKYFTSINYGEFVYLSRLTAFVLSKVPELKDFKIVSPAYNIPFATLKAVKFQSEGGYINASSL